MEFIRSYAISIWNTFDPLYYSLSRLTHLELDQQTKCVFRVRLTKFKGNPTLLSDGTQINKDDLLIKIHLHNVRLIKDMYNTKNDFQKAIHLFRQVQQSLPIVASYIEHHKHNGQIKGIVGITLLNKGARKLGFETFPLKSKMYRLFKLTSQFPICLLSRGKKTMIFSKEPMYLMMSKDQLFKRYRIKA